VDVECKCLGVLGVFSNERIAVPETSDGIDFLKTEEIPDVLNFRKLVILVPIHPICAIPFLVGLIFDS
jgi:hypothetical protein